MAQIGGKRIVILGGGLAGLTYLHYVRNFAAALNKTSQLGKMVLIEANDYMGGSIKTQVYEDGPAHELGPRSIRNVGVKSKNTIVLLEQLGLGEKIVSIYKNSLAAQDRYVYDNGELHRLPSGYKALVQKLPGSDEMIFQSILKDLRAPKMDLDHFPYRDPSLYDFIAYRFGKMAAEKFLDPMMRGITAGDARNLSTRAVFGDILEKEQVYGSIIKALRKPPINKTPHDEFFQKDIEESSLLSHLSKNSTVSYNLNCGLQTITEHLSNSLLNSNDDGLVSIYNQTKATGIEFNDQDPDEAPCSVHITTVDGDKLTMEADEVVSAIPACDFAKILPQTIDTRQQQAFENIAKIPHVPVGCVCVEYRDLDKTNLSEVVKSFGFLTNSQSGSRVLGISMDGAMFPEIDEPYNSTRMTCMIGGAWFKEMVGTDNLDEVKDSELEQIALEEIRRILRIYDEPFRMSPLLWKTGIAQYTPGHNERLARTRRALKDLNIPLVLLGQSYDGFAVNDVVFASRMAAYNFVKSL